MTLDNDNDGVMLHRLVRERRYQEALQLVQDSPNKEVASYTTKHGVNALMICASDDTSFESSSSSTAASLLVQFVLKRAPQLVAAPNRIGWNALHCWLCRETARDSPIARILVLEMIAACPEALQGVSSKAWTPLHFHCRANGDSHITQAILEADPSLAIRQASCCLDTPMRLLWNHASDCDENVDENDAERCRQNMALLLHAICKTRIHSIPTSSTSNKYLLHAACWYPCPQEYVLELLKRYPEQALERDPRGNVPLHYVASGAFVQKEEDPIENKCMDDECSRTLKDIHRQVSARHYATFLVQHLIDLHPQAVTIPNKDGRLPLQLALSQGSKVPWSIATLLRMAHIDVLQTANDEGLVPFLQSASSTTTSRLHLSLTYQLLLQTPEFVK